MSEPTIDDMVAWLDHIKTAYYYGSESLNATAIRAILEQRREEYLYELTRLGAIRAFIERVEKRLPDYNTGKGADSWLKAYRLAVHDELARMEQETK